MPWPQAPRGHEADVEFLKLGYHAQLDDEAKLSQAVHAARIEVGKAIIERGRSGAEFVRTAAAATVTLYTGVLGVAFATSEDATTLPARGLMPAFFLALAITCSSAYVALLVRDPSVNAPAPTSLLEIFQERRLNSVVEWAAKIALARVYFLHASVISLGFGALFLPIPFLDLPNWLGFALVLPATLIVFLAPTVTTRS